ncbi:conserved Plasmodium protein, unknown function [Plasmodium ovale]|uniref:Uncharacterized protein n=1 Tax=Plasmodium ovale TaxID=36330 RepID=A0A1C3KTA8_PLAOA|nr:conserved Plasmodium protein, unknown function [Plasmodium ovale]
MHGYSRNNVSIVENKQHLNDASQVKRDREENIFSFNDIGEITENTGVNFEGRNRREMNNEKTAYGYSSNSNPINRKNIEKENTLKNNVYNKNTNSSSGNLKKSAYYNSMNIPSNDKGYVKSKDDFPNHRFNKNYVDPNHFDDMNLTRDRTKFRRIGHFNEDNNLNMKHVFTDRDKSKDKMRGGDNISEHNRHFAEFKAGTSRGEKISGNKGGIGGIGGNGDNVRNYEYSGVVNRDTYDRYDTHNANDSYGKYGQYGNYGARAHLKPMSSGQSGNFSYGNVGRHHNKYGEGNLMGPPIPGVAPTPPYQQRDKMYHRNESDINSNVDVNPRNAGSKDNSNNDTMPQRDALNKEKNLKKGNINDVHMGSNAAGECNRGKPIPQGNANPNVGTFLGNEQSDAMAPPSKGGNIGNTSTNNVTGNDDDMSMGGGEIGPGDTRTGSNHPSKYPITGVSRDIYTNYNTSVKDPNGSLSMNVTEKEANRNKEHHNFSLSTIDSNYSNKNAFEKKNAGKVPLQIADPHLMGACEGRKKTMEEENIGVGDHKNEGKIYVGSHNPHMDRNTGGSHVQSEYAHFDDYDHVGVTQRNNHSGNENCRDNNTSSANRHKHACVKDSSGVNNLNNNVNKIEKPHFMDKEKMNGFSKNYEYGKNDMGNASPEFGFDNLKGRLHEGGKERYSKEERMVKGANVLRVNKNNSNGSNIRGGNNTLNSVHNVDKYSSSKYSDDNLVRKYVKNVDETHLSNNRIPYDDMGKEEGYHKYHSSDMYGNKKFPYENRKDKTNREKNDYMRRKEKMYYNGNMNYEYYPERGLKRPCHDGTMSYMKEKYKGRHPLHTYKKYSPEFYSHEENTPDRDATYGDHRGGTYSGVNCTNMDKHQAGRNYPSDYSHDSMSEKEALTIIRLPAESKKKVKKKKKSKVGSGNSLVDMYSTAIPISEKVDPHALKALSQNGNVNEKIYALIPKSVVEVCEYDDVTHVTLQSPSPLFVNQGKNVKQHIITTNYNTKDEGVPHIASCVVPLSDESLKESLEKSKDSLSEGENDKNLKSIIRGTSLRNKSSSSLSVKFKLSKGKLENRQVSEGGDLEEGKEMSLQCEDVDDNYTELNKKIENHIQSEELKKLKIDKTITEKKRASIFDESKAKPKGDKKNDINKKVVIDSSKVKKAMEIKLKRIPHVTGLLEKYDIPNPFEKYCMESIDFSQLDGQNNSAKLYSLALMVSSNYYRFIVRSMERAEVKEVFNEKRKKMILKLIALLGSQINTEIKRRFSQVDSLVPSKGDELKKEDEVKPRMSAKEKEIKVEEHKLICKYWEKQSECMSLLIKEWNKISEILESINVDPNNIINSLLSMYGEKAVSDFHLSLDEIKRSNIELDVNIEDISIPSVGEHSTNKFDPSGMTIMNLIQDLKWDMDIEYSLNQIREEWKNENKQNKKLIQKKIVEGIKHRVGLLDYLNKVEVNLSAFAKIIESRMISNEDVKSQLRSMQELNENTVLCKLLENLGSSNMDINAESFRTPTSFFASHHLPMTMCSLSGKSNTDGGGEEDNDDDGINANTNADGNDDMKGEGNGGSTGECNSGSNGGSNGVSGGESSDRNHDGSEQENDKGSDEFNTVENQSSDE